MPDLPELRSRTAVKKSPLRDLVIAEIEHMDGLIKVYSLASQVGNLRNKRVAANSVYRIMNDLHDEGKVKIVCSRNAFVKIPDNMSADLIIICNDCEAVTFATAGSSLKALNALALKAGYKQHSYILEADGKCLNCR